MDRSFAFQGRSIESIYLDGTAAMAATIDATAVVDNGDGTVKLTTTAVHGFKADGWVYVSGTTNYDGLRKITAVPSTTTLSFKATYVAETPAGTETIKFVVAPGAPFRLLEIRLHLGVACASVENLTVDLDSGLGSEYDVNIYTKAMNTVQDVCEKFADNDRFFRSDDKLIVAWPNAGGKTWGCEVIYERK